MAIDFPASPSVNDTFSVGGVTYTWDGTVWASSGPVGFVQKAGDTMTGDLTIPSLNGGQLAGFRNKIINGACQIAQRGTQATGITTAQYSTCDRWFLVPFGFGTWTSDQAADAPAGFTNSFKLTCTTADASPAAGDYMFLNYLIEAQDLQDLKYGNLDAETMTVSFYVKSNKTGGASFSLYQPDANRFFTTSYNIAAANTWEYKTIAIPGDISGLINNDNGAGLQIEWWLNSGSDFTGGSAQNWGASVSANRNFANLGVGGAVSDYFAITGVQLEVSPVATPLEHRPYGTELALCQRYFQLVGAGIGYKKYSSRMRPLCGMIFPVEMRTTPTAALISPTPSSNFLPLVNITGTSGGGTSNVALSEISSIASISASSSGLVRLNLVMNNLALFDDTTTYGSTVDFAQLDAEL